MKKVLILLSVLLLAAMAGGTNRPIINPEDLSLKAGPTDPGEPISMAWLEAYIYPKEIREEGAVSLGIRTTAKVDKVVASFDFGTDKVSLSSYDGMSWSGVYKIPDHVSAGLHVVRYSIIGKKGRIQRTVEFFVGKHAALAQRGEIIRIENWPLTVVSTCAALSGESSRILHPGQRVTGISKLPWYEVVFEDGEEGWISAAAVKEPLDEYHHLGYEAYLRKDYKTAIKYYQNAVAIEPDFVRGHLWLAKCYLREDSLDSAYRSIIEAIRLDERDIDCRVFADNLALKYYGVASAKFKSRRYHEAVAAYQRVLALKPNSVKSWIELGKCYDRLGMKQDARSAWREALGIDPENEEIYALLKMRYDDGKVASVSRERASVTKKQVKAEPAKPAPKIPGLPAAVADDSIEIVKTAATGKGTRIESALSSVIALTKSLGTPVIEKGWQTRKQGENCVVRYLCEQGEGMLEAFEWKVDIDSKRVQAANANARLLMDRW
jgi:hypothetical protein